MKTVMRQPDAEPNRNERIRVTHGHRKPRAFAAAPRARDPGCNSDQQQRFKNQSQSEDRSQHRELSRDVKQLREPLLECINRTHHPERIQQSTETEDDREHREIFALCEITNSRSKGIAHEFHRGHTTDNADVFMWTRLHTIETESAIDVANLARLKERELAAALNDYQRSFRFTHTTNAVLRRTTITHGVISNRDFKRRDCCAGKVELPDRTDELTERRMFEDCVDQQSTCEVNDDQPGGPPRRSPQIEPLVQKQHARSEEHT